MSIPEHLSQAKESRQSVTKFVAMNITSLATLKAADKRLSLVNKLDLATTGQTY